MIFSQKSISTLLIAILFSTSFISIPSTSAFTVKEAVNDLQAPTSGLPSGVANPKGTIGSLLSELFWGSNDGTRNGKIKGEYIDYAGISAWTQSWSDVYNNGGGNIGIGTVSPAFKLDVVGSAQISGNLNAGSLSAATLNSITFNTSTINGGTPINSLNIGSQSVNYATTAGTANAVNWLNVTNKSLGATAANDTTLDIGVSQLLRWKNYGTSHVIFDASQGTAPNGVAINNTNSAWAWTASYPTLMGWNGSMTYGVRVDSSRVADSASYASSAGSVPWTGITGKPSALSSFTNDNGFLTAGFSSTSGQPASVSLANETGYGAFQAQSQGNAGTAGAAFMSFHRPGNFAAYFGLDTDNQFKVGGWSMGANSYALLHSGNYNSYSPTLTGGGASGTWGINISGNAASATNARYLNTAGLYYQGGNVGIGTVSPTAKLEIYNNQDSATQLLLNNTSSSWNSGDPGITMKSRSSQYSMFANDETNGLLFWDNIAGVQRMELNWNGNFGIGMTPDSNTKFNVQTSWVFSASFKGVSTGTSGLVHIENTNAATSWNLWIEAGSWAGGAAGTLYIDQNASGPKLSIAPGGNVGIGVSSASSKLEVAGEITAHAADGWQGLRVFSRGNDNFTWAPLVFTNNGANYIWGITWTPTAATLNLGNSLATIMAWYPDGNAWLRWTLTQASDIRLKKDITPIQNSLEKISQLKGVNYYWKDSTRDSKLQIGVIAQDVEKVFPEAVATDEKGMKSVAYGNLVAPLIESVKELKTQKDSEILRLETENASIRKENADIKSRLEKLEQQ